jgi:hypothetical protein
MNFNLFLKEASTSIFWAQTPNLCFTGEEFSPLFFNALLSYTEKNNLLPYPKLNLNIADKKLMIATLNQSVLGTSGVFWLSEVLEEGEKGKGKNKQDIVDTLLNYQGPHHILYFIPKHTKLSCGSGTTVIDIPITIDYALFELVLFFLGIVVHDKKLELIKKIFKETKTITLDTACMFINYLELINLKHLDQLSYYLAYITKTQPSLNQLSDFFFANQATNFFSLWSKVESEYSDMFWIAFWSEQIWKAHHVIGYLKKSDFTNAKRMSFRLPYSFINLYWKNFSQQKCTHLYNQLYLIDMKIKQGVTHSVGLTFFFFSYFFEKTHKNNYTDII